MMMMTRPPRGRKSWWTAIKLPVLYIVIIITSTTIVPSCQASSSTTRRSTASGAYALYNLPSFDVIFETKATDLPPPRSTSKLLLLSETNGHNSALSFPIRQGTQTYLLQSLEKKVGILESQANAQDPNQEYPWFPMYAYLTGVDLSVSLYLLEEETNNNGGGDGDGGSSPSATTTIRAVFTGSLAFEEPSNPSNKPSNAQVTQVFGDWLEQIWSLETSAYWRSITTGSLQSLLQDATLIQVQMTTTSSRTGTNSGSGTMNTTNGGGGGALQSVVVTVLCLLGILSLSYGLLAVRQGRKRKHDTSLHRQWIQRNSGYSDDENDEYNFSGSIAETTKGMDAIRHGSMVLQQKGQGQQPDSTRLDAMELLQKLEQTPTSPTDRRNYNVPPNPWEALYAAVSSWTAPLTTARPLPISPQGAFTTPQARRRSSVLEEQAGQNLAAAASADGEDGDMMMMQRAPREFFQDELEEDEYYAHHSQHHQRQQPQAPSLGGSIWRNLTSFLDGNNRSHHENYYGNEYDGYGVNNVPPVTDLELQTGHLSSYSDDQMVVLEGEDPTDYDFPFQDFPRHDGTPCLMFNDDGTLLTPKQRQVFEIGSPETSPQKKPLSEPPALVVDETTPVSNDVFARMLAAQGANPNNSSPDASLLIESSMFSDDAVTVDDASTATAETSSSLPPDFKDTLSRLYEQKHRQYEKKAIVEKHQERRAKERKSQRELERRERHLMMEGTIEDLEVATGTTPRWSQATSTSTNTFSSSPKPYRAQQQQAQAQHQRHPSYTQSPKARYSPKPSSNYSPYRSSTHHHSDNISRASPIARKAVGRLDWDNAKASSRSLGSHSDAPLRMRPRTTAQPLPSVTAEDFWRPPPGHRPSRSHSTLDHLSMPPMIPGTSSISNAHAHSLEDKISQTVKKYSPNAVTEDVFEDGPTSILPVRRKNSIGSYPVGSNETTSSVMPLRRKHSIEKPADSAARGRGNSLDPKAVVGYERPLPQQRRRPRGQNLPGTPNRTRSRTPTRTSTPQHHHPSTRGLTPPRNTLSLSGVGLTPVRNNHPSSASQRSRSGSIEETTVGASNSSLGSSRHKRSGSSHSQSGDLFTHGIAAHKRFV